MNKKDIIILVVLVALMMAWPMLYQRFINPFFGGETQPAAEVTESTGPAENSNLAPADLGAADTAKVPPPETAEPAQTPTPSKKAPEDLPPEQTCTLENTNVIVTVSSRGGGIRSAVMQDYRATIEKNSGPVVLDFNGYPALVYENLPGLSGPVQYTFEITEGGRTVILQRTAASGLQLERTLSLDDRYVVTVHDRISNVSTQTIPIANTRLQLGGMAPSEGRSMRGVVNLGVDSLSPGGEKTKHWSKKLDDFFKDERKEQNLPKLPITVERRPYEKEVHWVAVKNKYFVQILTPEEISDGFVITAKRELAPEEKENPSFSPKMTGIERVSASIILPAHTLQPGEVITQQAVYYVGPKKYTELAGMGLHNAAVMEFGIWAPVSRILLRILNAIYDWVWPHNYGLAIILMTILIRIVFWPFTHKSTESMKRMQEIQPLVKSLREKYKDNPQKLQQETMALYKEHKVNPLGGCLPMLIQIPVFIALFVVLRSAIELRFASFLWIKDLSQPENLLAGAIPIVGALNILPLLMAFTMFLQQKLSPTGGDPQQQKVMAFMPIMLLVLLYNMASGLVLYWTTNQCLMIIQQLTMRRKQSQKKAASDGG